MWIAISGSWRTVNEEVKKDVETAGRKIIKNGDGLVTGGALGVDYIATQIVLKEGNVKKLKLFLPIKLDKFCQHFRNRAKEGVITDARAEMLVKQLLAVKKLNPDAINDDTPYDEANEKSYYARNYFIVSSCDELYAFQVNESKACRIL